MAIAIGAGVFGVIAAMRDPTLPLPGGDRIVAIQNNRADDPGNPDRKVLHDFVAWRSELTTVRDLGAFRLTSRNLIIEGGGTSIPRARRGSRSWASWPSRAAELDG